MTLLADADAAVGFMERLRGPSPPAGPLPPPAAEAAREDIVVMLTESSVDLGMTKSLVV